MRVLSSIMGDGLIMHLACSDRIQGQVKLVVPAELKTSLGQSIVPLLRTWMSFGQVSSMSSNAVCNEAGLDILPIWQAQMLLGSHVAQHSCPHGTDVRSTNGASNVVITRRNVGSQRAQGVEWSLVAPVQLFAHVVGDLVQWHMPWAFIHDLDTLLPSTLGQIALHLELAELGLVIGILDAARTESITNAEGHVVLLANVQNVIPVLVCEILLVLGDAQLGMDGTTTADNTSEALGCQWHKTQQHTRMNRPIVHTLFGLLDQRLAEDLPRQILRNTINLLQSLVNWDRANGHRTVSNDPLTCLMDVLSSAQVHQGISTPKRAPLQFLNLFLDGRGHCRVANIGIDLHLEVSADDHGLRLWMIAIGRNDGTSTCNFRADELRFHPLARCNKGHLFRDDALLGIIHLSASAIFRSCTALNPFLAQLWQTFTRRMAHRTRSVVDVQVIATWVLICEVNAAEGHTERFTSGFKAYLLVDFL
mmetsp:Transcript_59573/g.72914  ORF Transcript_59573/g.72914 Transcript_59573/m.72914 type:complete len:477 (+) Transcript_59573:302-1732(+)